MSSVHILLLLFAPRFAKAAQNWDYIIFAQTWPRTVCRIWLETNSTNTCNSHAQNEWSIHGIWPTLSGSKGPEYCNQTWVYDPEEVKSLEPELERCWVNILQDSPNYSLWAHEWDKHGTCAEVEAINSQKKYFSIGLEWFRKYTMTTVLSQANIIPSDTKTYTLSEIFNAIRNKLDVKPEIKCKTVDGKQYLGELRLCFSRSVELIDCKYKEFVRDIYDNDLGIISNCNLTGISYL